ncbi:hypothetical protein AB0H71_28795 [Nocardia sp. NPDC050697]|uniref:hypothetical protein n=1 Tax=Nocardia sp. NPDC050697 TaxID=3155158 RepID=UPI00340352EC
MSAGVVALLIIGGIALLIVLGAVAWMLWTHHVQPRQETSYDLFVASVDRRRAADLRADAAEAEIRRVADRRYR